MRCLDTNRTNSLFVISFEAGSESGLALVSAIDDKNAVQILRNSGKYNFTPDSYKVVQVRNIGLTSSIRMELLMESYVNALTAYEAIVSAANSLKGIPGDPGKSAYQVAVDNGFSGTAQEWLESLKGVSSAEDLISVLGYVPASPTDLSGKVDKQAGMGLSQMNYTQEDRNTVSAAQRRFWNVLSPDRIPNPKIGDVCTVIERAEIPFVSGPTISVVTPCFPVYIEYESGPAGGLYTPSGWSVHISGQSEDDVIWSIAIPVETVITESMGIPLSFTLVGNGRPINKIYYEVGEGTYQYITGGWKRIPEISGLGDKVYIKGVGGFDGTNISSSVDLASYISSLESRISELEQ